MADNRLFLLQETCFWRLHRRQKRFLLEQPSKASLHLDMRPPRPPSFPWYALFVCQGEPQHYQRFSVPEPTKNSGKDRPPLPKNHQKEIPSLKLTKEVHKPKRRRTGQTITMQVLAIAEVFLNWSQRSCGKWWTGLEALHTLGLLLGKKGFWQIFSFEPPDYSRFCCRIFFSDRRQTSPKLQQQSLTHFCRLTGPR